MSSPAPTSVPWYRQAARLIPHDIVLKSIGIPLFIAMFFAAYFHVLKNPAYPLTVMPLTWLDPLIGFHPAALSLYVSLWVYVSLPPAFLASRLELYVFGAAMACTCLAGLLVFYFWPTSIPAPDIDWALHPGMDFLKNMDSSGNAFPSLHVATAVFSGVWLHHLLRRFGAPSWPRLVNGLWCLGIVYSTLATRQHVAVDMWGGLVLGLLTSCLSLRCLAGARGHRPYLAA